jgi:DNA invertase Pin-like site-specific DNA recombinase
MDDLPRRGKVGLLSLHEAIDTTTTSGKLTFHLFGALAGSSAT